MSFELNYIDAVPIVCMDGELSKKNARWLDDLMISVLDSGQLKIILDLSQLKHIDYKLVNHLVERITELKCAGGDVAFAAANHYIRTIFEAMGYREYLYPTVGEALLGLADEMSPRPWQ